MVGCSAFGCVNRSGDNHATKKPGITFHRFPKDKVMRGNWIKAVRRRDWCPTKYSCLCSEHFRAEDMDRTSVSTVRIRAGAIPSIFPAFPSYLHTNSKENISERKRARRDIPSGDTELRQENNAMDTASPEASLAVETSEVAIALETPTIKKMLYQLKASALKLSATKKQIKALKQVNRRLESKVAKLTGNHPGESLERELINPSRLTLRDLRANAYSDVGKITRVGSECPKANSSQKHEIRMLLWELRNSNCQIQLSQKNSKLIKELQAKQMAVYKFLLRCRRQYKSIEGISSICFTKKSRRLDQEMSHSAALLFAEQFSSDDHEDIANLWTMDEKIKALMINKETPKLYIILESILALPPRNELRNLLNSFDIPTGMNSTIFENLTNRVMQMKNPKDKICVLLMDEFPLEPGVNHQLGPDKIIGFEDLGAHGQSRMPASYALVFMLRSLLKNWYQPVAYYFCHKEMPLVIQRRILAEVIESVTGIGLIVSAIVCDPSARNTSVLQSYIAIETYGPFITAAGNKVVKFYDPPSLLMNFRDFFMKHHIQFKGKTAKWSHLKILYEREREEEFCLAKKLTKNHLEPTESMMKKMNLVRETLSYTVASAMHVYATTDAPERMPMPWEAFGTAYVIRTVDNLYDSFYREQKLPKENKKMHAIVSKKSTHAAVWAEAMDFISDWKFYDPSAFKVVHTLAQDGWTNNIESCLTLRDILLRENIKRFSVRRLNLDPMRRLFAAVGYGRKGVTAAQFLANLKSYLLYESLLKSSCKIQMENGEDILLLDIRSDCKIDDESYYQNQLRSKCSDIPELDTLWAWEEPQLAYFEAESVMWVGAFIARFVVGKINCVKCHALVSSLDTSTHFVIEEKSKHLLNPSERLCQLIGAVFKICDQVLSNAVYEKGLVAKLTKICRDRPYVTWLAACGAHGEKMITFILNLLYRIIIHQYCKKYNKGVKKVKERER